MGPTGVITPATKISSTKGTEKNANVAKKNGNNDYMCFCKTLAPFLFILRFVGLLPLITVHEEGRCVFKKSNVWLVWAMCVLALYLLQITFATDILNVLHIAEGRSIHEILSAINDVMYSSYVFVLTLTNCVQYSRFAKTFNHMLPVLKEGIFCQSTRRILRRMQYGLLVTMVIVISVQYTAISWLHFSSSYTTSFDYKIVVNRFVQNVPFLFYIEFFCTCTLFIAFLVCFEKLTINALKFTPVHPMKGIDETNNRQDFLCIIKFDMCKEVHTLQQHLLKLKPAELVEYLRILHEDISTLMYEMNGCFNPQLLFHSVVELTVLIIHWYAVIIYYVFDFKSDLAQTVHFLNCLFVILHTLGLFLFLRTAQQMWNIVQGLNNFLLEYSTRISSQEEHQQVRIFIEKIKLHRPLTASGIFDIDLGIAGPICANILTYVLVALQFDVPNN